MSAVIQIASIVEGDGEVKALPKLLHRMTQTWPPPQGIRVAPLEPPIRVRRDQFLNKPHEFNRYLALAAAKAGEEGWVLVLLDADDDCPAKKGAEILERAQQYIPYRKVSVVLANREFEAWFIAAAQSLNGVRGFTLIPGDENLCAQAEEPRNAKGWLQERMKDNYKEIFDQPVFAAKMSLQEAYKNSRSFRKLCTEWQMHIMNINRD